MPQIQHQTTREVPSAHERSTQRRLNDAFQKIVAHLPRLPEQRFLWTNRRRASNPLPVPGTDAVHAAHVALNAAIKTRDPVVIEATALEVEVYLTELRAAMLAPYTALATATPSVQATGIDAHREMNDAECAITETLVSSSPAAMERALREGTEAWLALDRFLGRIRSALRPTPGRLAA